jgi:hypothetical protein
MTGKTNKTAATPSVSKNAGGRKRAVKLLVDRDGGTDVQDAIAAYHKGDESKHLILEFKAGNRGPLAARVQSFGLEPHSELAVFVAQVLAGKLTRTRHDTEAKRQHKQLVLVQRYSQILEWQKAHPGIAHPHSNEADRKMANMGDVFRRVADEVGGITDSAVAQTVKRRKRTLNAN